MSVTRADLVTRLRHPATTLAETGRMMLLSTACADMREAAVEIERLQNQLWQATARIETDGRQIERLRAAIRWALGEATDADGNWFGKLQPEDAKPLPYWWRTPLRKMAFGDEQRGWEMTDWPPPNLVHMALAELDRKMLTSPDGKNIQVSLEAICKLLANPPLMLRAPR